MVVNCLARIICVKILIDKFVHLIIGGVFDLNKLQGLLDVTSGDVCNTMICKYPCIAYDDIKTIYYLLGEYELCSSARTMT